MAARTDRARVSAESCASDVGASPAPAEPLLALLLLLLLLSSLSSLLAGAAGAVEPAGLVTSTTRSGPTVFDAWPQPLTAASLCRSIHSCTALRSEESPQRSVSARPSDCWNCLSWPITPPVPSASSPSPSESELLLLPPLPLSEPLCAAAAASFGFLLAAAESLESDSLLLSLSLLLPLSSIAMARPRLLMATDGCCRSLTAGVGAGLSPLPRSISFDVIDLCNSRGTAQHPGAYITRRPEPPGAG